MANQSPEDFKKEVKQVIKGRRQARIDSGAGDFPQDVLDKINQLDTGPVQDLQTLLVITQPPSAVCCRYTVNGIDHCVCGVSPGECQILGGTQVSSCGTLKPYNV